jgi:hypothetical protein
LPFFDFLSRKKPSLAEQLATLAGCGISPNKNFLLDQLEIPAHSEFYEKSPFTPLLCALGDDSDEAPYLPHSNNIWHFDTECIEGDGSYVRIAERLALLAGDFLRLEDVRDRVDNDEEIASLSFTFDGQKIEWAPKVNEDWVDERILSNFAELLNRKKAPRRFTYCGLFGQDCLIGCATPEQLDALRKATGLKFVWLT